MNNLNVLAFAVALSALTHPPGGPGSPTPSPPPSPTPSPPPSNPPVILYTDFVAGPTSGGDGNNGAFLSIYGFNFDTYANWGVTNFVTIGGVQVANYRCLVPAVGSGTSTIGRGVYETWGLMCLTVQVGSLGGAAAGTALKIDMTVGGVHPANAQDGSSNYLGYNAAYDGTRPALMFTPQPATIYFVDRINGSDSNNGLTPTTPKKTIQDSTGFVGIYKCASGVGQTDGMKPGTHVYDMGGTTTTTGLAGRIAFLFRIGGTAPTGAANHGPICFSRYPGAVGANSPAVCVFMGTTDGSGNGGGGFIGNDTQRAGETNPYDGLASWSRWHHVSNIKISSATNAARDGGPIEYGSSSDDCRTVNCDLTWPFVSNASGITNSAGINGNGLRQQNLGNWIHSIGGVVAQNQCHGIYHDGSLVCAKDCTDFLNCIYDIQAGNGIQSFNSQASDTIQRMMVLCNWIEKTNKHGLNCGQSTSSRYDLNNIVIDSGEAGYHITGGAVDGANAVRSANNTIYGFAQVVGTRAAWWNEGGNSGGATDHRNNIYAQKAGATAGYSFVAVDAGPDNFTTNVFYDFAGNLTSVSATYGTYHDPGLTAPTSHDFSLTSSSFCKDAGTTPLISRPFDFLAHKVTGTPDIGALEFGAAY